MLAILVPTVLMGATLPALTRFVARSMTELRQCVASLYAINSAGAVAGCAIAAFWWIPTYGLEMALYGGAALNLTAGCVALVTSQGLKEGGSTAGISSGWPRPFTTGNVSPHGEPFSQGESPTQPAGEEPPEERFRADEIKLALMAIAVSGFVAMLYEVAWTRLLALAVGSSTHAFSIMLMTFITGLTVGSWVVSRWGRLRRTMQAFAWAELALASAILVSMFIYEGMPYWFVKLANLLARREEAYPIYLALQVLICFAVMFVPTVCLGMTLPLASRIATKEIAATGRSIGNVFAVNTLGTVLGAVVTGLWIMPAFGLAQTFALGAALNALIGVVILARNQRHHWATVALSLLLGLGWVWFAGSVFDRPWQRIFTLGFWRLPNLPETFADFRKLALAEDVKFYRDGAGATVSVYSWTERDTQHFSLKVNGKTDANTKANVPTQLLLGHIPMLLHSSAESALVIGLGSGMTCAAVARHPTVRSLDIVEISPEVAEAAKLFAGHNDRVLEDPRVRLVIDDAKSHLQITGRQYDVIISEPSNPWMAGVAGVFSREFYEQCRRRLSTRGLMVQWVHLDETSDAALNIVLATFTSEFPHASVWQGLQKDLILVGAAEPFSVNLAALAKRFESSAVKADLARMGVNRLAVFLGLELVSPGNTAFLPPSQTPVHSDYYPVLEYEAQKGFFIRANAEAWRIFDETASPRPATLLARHLKESPLSEADYRGFVEVYAGHRLIRPQLLRSLLRRWHRENPQEVLPMEIAALLSEPADLAESQVARLSPFVDLMHQQAERDPESLRRHTKYAMQVYRTQRCAYFLPPSDPLESALARLLKTDPDHQRVYRLYLAELAWDRGDDAACLKYGQSAFDPGSAAAGPIRFALDPATPEIVLARMAETLWRSGRVEEAWALCEQARIGGYVDLNWTGSLLAMTYRKIAAAKAAANLGRSEIP